MNGVFLLLALGLCVLALAFVLIPLLREPRGVEAPGRREVLLTVHRDRVVELDQDLASGTLTAERHARALAALERELLDSGVLDGDTAAGEAMPRPPQAEPRDEEMGRGVRRLVEGLQARLAQNPGDLQGWGLVGRTLGFLDEFEAAGRALREALRHGGDRDPEVLVRYADVLAEIEGTLEGEPAALIEQALAIDPENAQGLWLAGTRAYQAGAHEEARAYWERLLAVPPEGPAEAAVIRGNLMQLQQP